MVHRATRDAGQLDDLLAADAGEAGFGEPGARGSDEGASSRRSSLALGTSRCRLGLDGAAPF
ncbi:MAG TPA: hypothetical protein VHW74_02195 [Mycobacteriales bacterium]|nr:hypothetical protein [Mycobacteriales bacterium]